VCILQLQAVLLVCEVVVGAGDEAEVRVDLWDVLLWRCGGSYDHLTLARVPSFVTTADVHPSQQSSRATYDPISSH
jgi:hypothetical protein